MLVGYARVSTADQTPQMQIAALERAGCERIFEETASGAKRDRAQLAAAIDYMREGDTLVVWRLDRLARSQRQLIDTIEGLEERGIKFQSLTETFETKTASGRLIFHFFAGMAEFERGLIRERTMEGLEKARAMGKLLGRPRRMGDEDLVAARALLRQPGFTRAGVAKRLGVSESTLYRRLREREAEEGSAGSGARQ